MNKKIFIILCFIILAVSLLDINVIPFYSRPGLDFSNQFGFHHCANSLESIYKISPSLCQDFANRPYVYPPTHYYLFFWTRFFSTANSAYFFYLFLSIISFLIVIYIWTEKKITSVLFALGLFFTFPNLFLLERGNGDLFIVLFWSLSYFFFLKKKFGFMSFFLSLSIFSKLYPIYAFIILAAYFISKDSLDFKIQKSVIISSIFFLLISPFLWFEYLLDVLPGWSAYYTGLTSLTHTLKSIPTLGLGTILFPLCLICWTVAAIKTNSKRLAWIWTGALAISTFNNGISYDYNLVTIFPFAIVAFNYLSQKENRILAVCFSTFFFIVFGSRALFINYPNYPLIRLLLLGILLIFIPFYFFDMKSDLKNIITKFKFLYITFRK